MGALRADDPRHIGGYRLLGRLGTGGMGQVFLGRSLGGRLVAVKLLRVEHTEAGQFRDRFAREIEAARRVGGFHTAPVVDADPDADPPWMVTAYIPGPSLHRAVTERGPLTVAAVGALGAGLAEGLAAIHACDLVHRDLKPSNVILAADGPRIIDFGVARVLDADPMTTSGAVVGTYAYMSPEQVRGQPVGPAGDVFSLGCVLTFAATSHSPFDAGSIATIVHRIVSEPPDLTDLPEEYELHDLISACLSKDSHGRPTVADILARLNAPDAGTAWPPPAIADMISSAPAEFSDTVDVAADDTGHPARPQPTGPGPDGHPPTSDTTGQTTPSQSVAGVADAGIRARDGGIDLVGPAAQLAMAVSAQWRDEEERRRVHDPFPLPVHWRTAAAQLADHWANIRRAPAGGGAAPLVLEGRLEQIADAYRHIPSGRLVVLGRAGAGKTIVALRLVLDMISARGEEDRVPVVFSVGSWDPATASLRRWVVHELERLHPALAGRGHTTSMAAALVSAGRILPVLDGFDEMAGGLRRTALHALNATAMPLVLTSRVDEYAAVVTTTDVLSAAAVIELDELTLADLAGYLPRTTRPTLVDGQPTSTWDPVLTHLRDQPADPASRTLQQVLTTPLIVSLARTIYSDTPGHDPTELLTTAASGAAQDVEDHLLGEYTRAAYQDPPDEYPDGHPRRWDPAQARRWLGYLARDLDRRGTHDLTLWQLGTTTSRLATALERLGGHGL